MTVFGSGVRACPCGSDVGYDGCCGGLLRGERVAETAEQLMRSRYTAYVLGEEAYVFRTWHPATRPQQITDGGAVAWTGLEVKATRSGSATDEDGIVEFVACYIGGDGVERAIQEVSHFTRRGGRWVYERALDEDGEHDPE